MNVSIPLFLVAYTSFISTAFYHHIAQNSLGIFFLLLSKSVHSSVVLYNEESSLEENVHILIVFFFSQFLLTALSKSFEAK